MSLIKLSFMVYLRLGLVISESNFPNQDSQQPCPGFFLKRSFTCQENSPGMSCDGLCVVDCVWSDWQDAGQCSSNICGTDGTIPIARYVIQKQQNGGAVCEGEKTGMRTCFKDCGVALVVGGHQPIGGGKKVELWSPSGRCNRNLAPAAIKRKAATLNLFDGQVITCGGTNEDNAWLTCHTLDLDTHTWNFHSSLRQKRWSSSSASLGNSLWLIGSSDLSGRENSEYLEAGSTRWIEGPAITRVGFLSCTAKISQTQFVTMGGHNKGAKRFAKMYDTSTDIWIRLPDLLMDRIQFMCISVNVRKPGRDPITGVLVVGGQDASATTAEFLDFSKLEWNGNQDFDVSSMEWKLTGNMNYPHQRGAMVDLGGRYFVIAGLDTKTVEEFDPFTLNWKKGYPKVKYKRDYFPSAISVPPENFDKCQI